MLLYNSSGRDCSEVLGDRVETEFGQKTGGVTSVYRLKTLEVERAAAIDRERFKDGQGCVCETTTAKD